MPGFKRIKIKVCLLGDPAVGKTSLIQKYIYNFFGDTYMRTLGTKVSRKVVQIHNPSNDMTYEVTMMIWDIMGQKFTSVPLDKYLKMSQGALIVCDITRRKTYDSLVEWKSTLYKESEPVPVIYLANKYDLEKDHAISEKEFSEFSKNEKVPSFYTSAKTGENVENAFLKLGELIISSTFDASLVPGSSPVIGSGSELTPASASPAPPAPPASAPAMVSKDTQSTTPATTAPTVPEQANTTSPGVPTPEIEIKPGIGYIIKEEKPQQSFSFFKKLLQENIRGLCITRTHPNRIKEEFDLGDIPMYWLSADAPKKENIVVPTFLPQLNTIIIDFIQKYDNVVILLEGIEYLIDQNDFKSVLSLIHSMNDYLMGSNARLIIPIDPLILNERELHMLARDFKIV